MFCLYRKLPVEISEELKGSRVFPRMVRELLRSDALLIVKCLYPLPGQLFGNAVVFMDPFGDIIALYGNISQWWISTCL